MTTVVVTTNKIWDKEKTCLWVGAKKEVSAIDKMLIDVMVLSVIFEKMCNVEGAFVMSTEIFSNDSLSDQHQE